MFNVVDSINNPKSIPSNIPLCFIKFLTDGTVETKVLRFISGFIGLEFIINVILPLIGETPIGGFLQYFLVMVFVMLIYPIIFKFFESRSNKVEN